MVDTETKEIKVKGKQESKSQAELTRPGLYFTPDVDIFETEQEITLLADIPGVTPDFLNIDLRDNTLTLTGETNLSKKPGEQNILKEFEFGQFYRQFTLSEVIDQSRIDAKLNNGVLRLTLPKVEKAKPRKITVSTG